jgi:signal transduction histidine kinase
MGDKGSMERKDPVAVEADAVPLGRGLSMRLLFLTILFVMLAEVLIFLPSVANFRLQWLEQRLATAAAVSSVLMESGPQAPSRQVQDELLRSLGATAIAVRDAGMSRLLASAEMPPQVDQHIPVAQAGPLGAIADALDTMFSGGDRLIRAYGPVGESDKEYELILPDGPLRAAMLVYARNVAVLSLIISLITATLVFYAINRNMIRPIRAMTRSMLAFAGAPDDPARIIVPSARTDELGVAQRELAAMQGELRRVLGEQKHLADLGLAVSKINHDMRNILASAQLISDRLREARDPMVQAVAPKLLRALDRAVAYSEGVLAYGRTQEAAPQRRRLRLGVLVDEVIGLLGVDPASDVDFRNEVAPDFEIDADAEQLFRVLTNLARNAMQAMAGPRDGAVVNRLSISSERQGSVARILVSDTGPGLPPKARENLFAAFRGSARSGGTGLGLAIAHELVRLHGGTLELMESQGTGTVFAISIPDQPVMLEQVRRELRRPA